MVQKKLIKSLKDLFVHIKYRRKIQFLILLVFTVIAGLLEILSIASIVPFTRLVTDDAFLQENFFISNILGFLMAFSGY